MKKLKHHSPSNSALRAPSCRTSIDSGSNSGSKPPPQNQFERDAYETCRDEISIVGYSLRAPNTSNVPDFAAALRAGKDLTTSNTRYPSGHLGLPPRQGRIRDDDIACFDADFFGLSHKQADAMDPLIRMLLPVSYEALLDAALCIDDLRGSKTGVYVGHCFSDDGSHKTSSFNPHKNGYELVNGANSMAANRLSYFYDFKGPSIVIDTACSSSLVALNYAVKDLQQGIIDRAVVAGLSLTTNPHKNATFAAFKMLSPTGHCHVFDSRADGYCRSDGVACIVLERGNRGRALIAGIGVNSDGSKAEGITYPSSEVQAALMEEVLGQIPWINRNDIKYHEAHGTGTIAGDREELAALNKVYRHQMTIGSVKSNMGHAEGASGLMGLIKILLMMEDKYMYPNHDFQSSPHSVINSNKFEVLKSVQKWEPGASSISSFGFGGTNSFLVLTPLQLYESAHVSVSPSKTISGLAFAASKSAPCPTLKAFYQHHSTIGNAKSFPYTWNGSEWTESSPLVFVFNGQGSNWENMGADLIETNEIFRSTIERLESKTSIPLLEWYRDGSKWLSKEHSPIGIVSFQLGLLSILRENGIRSPDFFLGHSIGELSCPFLAGLCSEEQVLQFALVRKKLLSLIDPEMRIDLYEEKPTNGCDHVISSQDNLLNPLALTSSTQLFAQRNEVTSQKDSLCSRSLSMKGKMIVVSCTKEVINAAISQLDLRETRVACYNTPKGQTVSGPCTEVDELVQYLKDQKSDVLFHELQTDNVAYHAIYLEVFRDFLRTEFEEVIQNDPSSSADLPCSWLSTSRNDYFDTNYLIENIVNPVYFQEAIDRIPKGSTVVEIGPSSILISQIKRTRADLFHIDLFSRENPTMLDVHLKYLKEKWPKSEMEHQALVPTSLGVSPYKDRYPRLWSTDHKFHVMRWDEFELPNKSGEAMTIEYDLTSKPWNTLRDHIIRGQNLFPVAAFLHALWQGTFFKANVEILNFKIHTPLIISSGAKNVKLILHKAGPNYELWDSTGNSIRHASARVQIVNSVPASVSDLFPEKQTRDDFAGVEGNYFYPNIRRLGYEYGDTFQLISKVNSKEARLKEQCSNWILYIDAMLHLRLFNEESFGYPVGFDRVFFRGTKLVDAPVTVFRPHENTICNNSILLEGLRMEYLPLEKESYTLYEETFVTYTENDADIDLSLLASLLCRESSTFSIQDTLVSSKLLDLVDLLKDSVIMNEIPRGGGVVISENVSNVEGPCLLITMNKNKNTDTSSFSMVARWNELKAYRIHPQSKQNFPVVSNWQNASTMNESFVWKCDGASGAVASLAAETKGRHKILSYEGGTGHDIERICEKGMRHNFFREDGSHGVYVNTVVDVLAQGAPSKSAYLVVSQPGHLSSLEWKELDPATHSVNVSVAALNFRDVMRALGQLKEKDLSVGLEFSGYDRILKKRVFGVAKNAISSHCSPVYAFETPPHLSDVEAATIPVVYLTAYYALFHKANLKKGQSVLIHAGTGGVGMAAITLAQSRGLKVFATCSSSKRHYLKERFGLQDSEIGDSRSESFVQTVLDGTQQKGVDAALNQLSGSLQLATLRCLSHAGHFLEIGKYDILQNSALMQGLLAANISFHVIDLLPLLHEDSYTPVWNEYLRNGFKRGEIVPLPVKEFNYTEAESAFRFMSQAKHYGKLVITGLDKGSFSVTDRAFNLGLVHLITGGLGGLGLRIAQELASRGCKKIYLVGRRGVTTEYQRNQLEIMRKTGCDVIIIKSDIMTLRVDELQEEPDRIWHAATVYDDVLLSEMSSEKWDAVFNTKVQGFIHLKKIWPSCCVIAFSSVAAYYGNALQTSYALSNATLDAYARKKEWKLVSIRLGPLDNVGFITQSVNHRRLFERVPFEVMNIDNALSGIMQIVGNNQTGVFSLYNLKHGSEDMNTVYESRKKSSKNQHTYAIEDAQKFVSIVLGGDPADYAPNISLKAAGLDSLSTMEVVNHVHKETNRNDFKPSDIDDRFTVSSLVNYIQSTRSHNPDYTQESGHFSAASIVPLEESSEEDVPQTSNVVENNITDVPVSISGACLYKEISLNKELRILTVKIPASLIEFSTLLSALETSDILILRQAQPLVFNHGAPIESSDETTVANFMDNYVELAHAFETTESVVVVAVEGEARGGGMLFPAIADVCVATKDASFGLPEIHRNMIPSVVSKALVERLGRSITRRLSLTGESFSADDAMRMGLVDKVLENNDVDRYIADLVRRWDARESATHFIKKKLLPRDTSQTAMGMGTIAGTWLMQQTSSPMEDHEVLSCSFYEKDIAILTMCDSKYQNTMTLEMTAAIRSILPRLQREAKVIILTSSLKHFHVGLNPAKAREWRNRPTCHVAADMKESYMGFVELANLGIPLIAVLNGKVYGGGIPISLWCDYRIASNDVDFHYGNISRGMSPAGQLSQLFKVFLPQNAIMEAYLENKHWTCDDLLRLQIVSSVHANREIALSEAKELALFIAKNPSEGIKDTLHMIKNPYIAQIADEEAWLIARKITESQDLFRASNDEFIYSANAKRSPSSTKSISEECPGYGIIAFEVYTPAFAIDADTLETNNIPAKKKHDQQAVGVWDSKEDSISMALSAVSKLLDNNKHTVNPYSIGRIEVGTESNVDMAKSIKSYVMDLFPSDHVNIEGVDNTNACYGGIAALLNTIQWCQATGGYGIVIATDTADMGIEDSSWRGAAAVAMLVGQNPWVEIHPERTSCFKNTQDFFKPRFTTQTSPFIQTKESMINYINALDTCITSMKTSFGVDVKRFDAFVFHGGLCAKFMKLVERHLLQINNSPSQWKTNFEHSRCFASQMGGLYTASVFINLLSLLNENINYREPTQVRETAEIGIFGYGSGSSSTLIRATIHHQRSHDINLSTTLKNREMVSFDTLSRIVKSHEKRDGANILRMHSDVFYKRANGTSLMRSYYKRTSEDVPWMTKGEEITQDIVSFPWMTEGEDTTHRDTTLRSNHSILTVVAQVKKNQRLQASIACLIGWLWWIFAAIFFGDNSPIFLFAYSVLVFAVTFLFNQLVKFSFTAAIRNHYQSDQHLPSKGWFHMMGHYGIGLIVFFGYLILLAISRTLQLQAWRPIYFGWYSYDTLSFLLLWEDLSQAFRDFQSIHHSLSLMCTGTWIAVGGDWNELMIIAVTIWLTSDIWHYTLSCYKMLHASALLSSSTRYSPGEWMRYEQVAFWMERGHRVVSYLFIFFIEERSVLVWLILGTGFFFDLIDSYFRLASIRKRRAELNAREQALLDSAAEQA